ncbi:MAG TPA: SDR family NAD(P)-dependent oxidoreductase, partial [Chitinophagaceae bacterium]
MHKPLYTFITGASSGLGKQLAIQCASRKMNLVLVALKGTGLLSLSEVLQEQYAIDVITIEIDLCVPEACRFIYEEVKKHHITIQILINNAGAGGTFFF